VESQIREDEDTPQCLAIVTYTGASTDPETNNWHGGVLAVNEVPSLTVDECVDKIGVWSGLKLWRAGGKGTPDEFFEDGPFTLHADNGRPGNTGNFVVLSYFKAVVENFCARYQLVYKTILQDLLLRFDLEHDNPRLPMYQGSFESATAAGWSAATPIWASIGKQPHLVTSNLKYLRGIFWKTEHPFLLPASSVTLEQMIAIAKFLESTVKDTGEDNSTGGDFTKEDEGDNNSQDNWVGIYPPEEAAAFAAEVGDLSGGADAGSDGDSGGATMPVEISRAVS
jgi:hypothetical protein